MRRRNDIREWREQRRRRHQKHHRSDAKTRRSWTYRRTSRAAYRVHVSDDGRTTWGTFLAQMTSRPGWSVARLARESGVHRSTIFRWIKGDGGLTLASVGAIAKALDIDPDVALRAAGSLVGRGAPDAAEDDEEMRLILTADVDDEMKRRMIDRLVALRDRDKQRRMEVIGWMLDGGERSA